MEEGKKHAVYQAWRPSASLRKSRTALDKFGKEKRTNRRFCLFLIGLGLWLPANMLNKGFTFRFERVLCFHHTQAQTRLTYSLEKSHQIKVTRSSPSQWIKSASHHLMMCFSQLKVE